MLRYMVFNKNICDRLFEENKNIKISLQKELPKIYTFNNYEESEDEIEKRIVYYDVPPIITNKTYTSNKIDEICNHIVSLCRHDDESVFYDSAMFTLGIYNCYWNNIKEEITDLELIENLKNLKNRKILKERFPLSFVGEKKKKNNVTKFLLNKAGSEIFKYMAGIDSDGNRNEFWRFIKLKNEECNKISFKRSNKYFSALNNLYKRIIETSDDEINVDKTYTKYNELYLTEMILGYIFSKYVYDFMTKDKLPEIREREIIINLTKTIMYIKSPIIRIKIFKLISKEIEFKEIVSSKFKILTDDSNRFVFEIMKILEDDLVDYINDSLDFRVYNFYIYYKNKYGERYEENIFKIFKESEERYKLKCPEKDKMSEYDLDFNAIQVQMFQAFRQKHPAIDKKEFEKKAENYMKKFVSERPFGKYTEILEFIQ